MENSIEALQSTPAFAGLSEESLRFLLERATLVRKEPGELFFAEGDFGDAFYLLEQGRVEIYKTRAGVRRHVAILGEGDCVGEMALLSITDRSASVVAIEPCVALKLTNKSLHELYKVDTGQFALAVMNLGREVCRRLRDLNETLITQAVADAQCGPLPGPRPPINTD